MITPTQRRVAQELLVNAFYDYGHRADIERPDSIDHVFLEHPQTGATIDIALLHSNVPASHFPKLVKTNTRQGMFTAGIILVDYSTDTAGLRADKPRSSTTRDETILDRNIRENVYHRAPPQIKVTAWEGALSHHTQGRTTRGGLVEVMKLPYIDFFDKNPRINFYQLHQAYAKYDETVKDSNPIIQDKLLPTIRHPVLLPIGDLAMVLPETNQLKARITDAGLAL